MAEETDTQPPSDEAVALHPIVVPLTEQQMDEQKGRAFGLIKDGETFDASQVQAAIESFLEWGERQYGKGHKGYFSGPGWAARCLRYHLATLQADGHNGMDERARISKSNNTTKPL